MTTRNVQTVIDAFDAFNEGDLQTAMENVTESIVWEDHGRGVTYKTREELKDHYADILRAFPDAQAAGIRLYEAGDTVVVQYVASFRCRARSAHDADPQSGVGRDRPRFPVRKSSVHK